MSPFYRDTWVEVQLDGIYHNVKSIKEYLDPSIRIIAVVKANAYGHGDVQVAKTAIEAGASYLAVAFLDEALALRKSGIKEPILVLGVIRPEDATLAAEHNISVTVFQLDWLQLAVNHLAPRNSLNLHIKFDSGMGRLGLKTTEELNEMMTFVKSNPTMVLEGLYTHFATADEIDTDYFDFQYAKFEVAVDFVRTVSVNAPMIHCGNSAASLQFPTKMFHAVRLGIAMYGLSPSEEMKGLLPFPLQESFSLHSCISHVKKVSAGEKVSYGATYTVDQEEWVGTVPIGYADGWVRSLKNREVLVNGLRMPIIGRVCMDQIMIRLPNHVEVGTKVTLIGEQGQEFISIDEIAQEINTINYEIPCMISYRVPRVFIKNNEVIDVVNPLLHDLPLNK
ncbi:alanine racemase [Bacillus sp. DJP31]|uniref:alanine racemase n=1 Tax=Bacillus sp. DJP31 TaxID=3409789 RepID=UPI003BB663A9